MASLSTFCYKKGKRDDKRTSWFCLWKTSDRRKWYTCVDCKPGKVDRNILNIIGEMGTTNAKIREYVATHGVEKVKEEFQCFVALVKFLAGDADHKPFLQWLAHSWQHPEESPEVMVVVEAKKGVGKSTLGKKMVALFGGNGMETDINQLFAPFNAQHKGKFFLVCEEEGLDKKMCGKFRQLMTGDKMQWREKYKTNTNMVKRLHMMMVVNPLTNAVIWVGNNARRVMYLKPGSELAGHMQMLERFREVPLEVVAYGLSKLVDMEGFDMHKASVTDALLELEARTLGVVDRFWHKFMCEGRVPYYSSGDGYVSAAKSDKEPAWAEGEVWLYKNRDYTAFKTFAAGIKAGEKSEEVFKR